MPHESAWHDASTCNSPHQNNPVRAVAKQRCVNAYAVGFGGMSGFSRFRSVMNSSPVMVSFL